MKKYIEYLAEKGIQQAKIIDAKTIEVVPWAIFKCQYGCSNYNTSWCCPPHTPDHNKMKEIIGSYHTAVLFSTGDITLPARQAFELSKKIFLDGYYKSIALGSGPCRICKDFKNCTVHKCNNPERAIPSMEACGIDVFQTARNNGFQIEVTRDTEDIHHYFGMVLIE